MKRLTAQMRLDAMRTLSQGSASVWFFLILAPAFAFVIPLVAGGAVTGGIGAIVNSALSGSVIGIGCFLTLYPFFYEDQGDHRRINGLIPISRAHQVVGRYLFVLACLLIILLDLAAVRLLAWTGTALAGGVEATGGAASLGRDILFGPLLPTLVVMVMDALAMPLLYRYPPAVMMRIISIAFVCCVAVGAILIWGLPKLLPASAMSALTSAIGALAGVPPSGAMLAFTLVAVAAYALSSLPSRRFHRAKEL